MRLFTADASSCLDTKQRILRSNLSTATDTWKVWACRVWIGGKLDKSSTPHVSSIRYITRHLDKSPILLCGSVPILSDSSSKHIHHIRGIPEAACKKIREA